MLGVSLLLGACNQGSAPPSTVGEVVLQRYQGTWYELARLPMFFQRNCLQSEAHYQVLGPERLAVTNRCRTAEGEWLEAQGEAWPQVEGRTDRLWVQFDNTFSRLFPWLTRGAYWVLYLDSDYQLALVGSPDRDFLWLLSRTPEVSEQTRAQLLEEAQNKGYRELERLIWRVAD